MRYTPFETMERMFDQMIRDMTEWREQSWDDRFGERFGFGFGLNTDLAEHDGEYVLTVDLPGFETEEIDLRYDDGVLHLSASHEVAEESETGASSRSRTVSERIAIPREIVAEEIEASYRNGVLEVHLPVVEGGEEHGHQIQIE